MVFQHGRIIDYVPGPNNALELPLVLDVLFITRSNGVAYSLSPRHD